MWGGGNDGSTEATPTPKSPIPPTLPCFTQVFFVNFLLTLYLTQFVVPPPSRMEILHRGWSFSTAALTSGDCLAKGRLSRLRVAKF